MTSLFIKEIPCIPNVDLTENELTSLKTYFSDFNTYYVASATIKERRDFFENLWKSYEPYADRNFIKEAQKRFHQRTWEMYMGNVFLKNSLTLERAGINAPDIKIIFSSKTTMWVECIAPEKGKKADRVPVMTYGIIQSIPEEQMLLRIAGSFKEKSDKFLKYIQNGVVKKNEPRIIAINRADLGYMDGDPPLIIKALFSIGYLTLLFNKDHTKVINTGYSRIDKIIKKTGAEVVLGYFLNDQYKHISAVIYSHRDVLNHLEPMGTECTLVLNPFAETPLSSKEFPFMVKWVCQGKMVYRLETQKEVKL